MCIRDRIRTDFQTTQKQLFTRIACNSGICDDHFVRPSVCPSVRHTHGLCRNDYTYHILSSGSPAILFLSYRTSRLISDAFLNKDVKCRWSINYTDVLEWPSKIMSAIKKLSRSISRETSIYTKLIITIMHELLLIYCCIGTEGLFKGIHGHVSSQSQKW